MLPIVLKNYRKTTNCQCTKRKKLRKQQKNDGKEKMNNVDTDLKRFAFVCSAFCGKILNKYKMQTKLHNAHCCNKQIVYNTNGNDALFAIQSKKYIVCSVLHSHDEFSMQIGRAGFN